MTKFNKSINKICIAYLDLLEKKSASSITIVDLCDEANVARSTFYDNFENISDVTQAITAKMEEPLIEYIENLVNKNNGTNKLKAEELLDKSFLVYLLETIRENRVFAKSLLKYIQLFKSEEISHEFYEKIWIPYFEKSDIPEERWEKVFLYYQSAMTAIIKKWIEDGCEESIEDILKDLKYYANLTMDK